MTRGGSQRQTRVSRESVVKLNTVQFRTALAPMTKMTHGKSWGEFNLRSIYLAFSGVAAYWVADDRSSREIHLGAQATVSWSQATFVFRSSDCAPPKERRLASLLREALYLLSEPHRYFGRQWCRQFVLRSRRLKVPQDLLGCSGPLH